MLFAASAVCLGYRGREVSALVVLGISMIVFAGLTLGFLLGLFAFRVKSRWCPRCGAVDRGAAPGGAAVTAPGRQDGHRELPIGRRVAQLRVRRGMSQQVFADRIGRSKSWVDKVVRHEVA
ncbi:Helix-turn-helix domain-containing protein [Micromonospora inyonensis]|uniref:Helix-turn-helix domain-containing protein n=1 Tax=Micromonospora inyonensis TaxID=47866 RepID=A0A1C6RZ81_9ACTN|nr:helix-turn-helix domain-containing protein [Micromonospora inyonensis]SCL22483.1 Helix-turn-helix domain-containing protein [Micromonospora inyonensis]